MIACLQGKVVNVRPGEAVLLTAGGVGYAVRVSPDAAKQCAVGSEVMLETQLVVREDAHELYGFANGAEKKLFQNFLTVSGVGPKTALHLLSLGSVEETALAIARGDLTYLTKVSGIGKKIAERIVVELKTKLAEAGASPQLPGETVGSAVGDVVDALIGLGYSQDQAREAVKKVGYEGKNSEELLRAALRSMSR